MALKFTTTDQAAQMNGVKVLVYGGAGMGKTVLCSTAPNPIILSAEGGELSLRNLRIPMIEITTVQDLTEAHQWLCGSAEAKQFQTVCIDSLSEVAEVVLNNAKRQVKDPRQAYGELIEKMESVIRAYRDLPGMNVYMSAKMEPSKDELTGVVRYGPAMPGSKLGSKLPYFFDEVFRLGINKTPQGESYRFLQTQPDMQYEAKDRSGALAAVEPPHLAQLFNKILGV
jgi:hypothetical protein